MTLVSAMAAHQTVAPQKVLVTCPRCLSENDKTSLVTQTLARTATERQKKVMVIAQCGGCALEVPLMLVDDGQVEVVDVDPYRDVEEVDLDLSDLPPVPAVVSAEQAERTTQEGNDAFTREDYPQAYSSWRAAREWHASRPEARRTAAALLSNMGMALNRMHAPSAAISCFEEALRDMNPSENPDHYATVLNNIGAAYLHLGRMKRAVEFHRRAYEVHLQYPSDTTLLARERSNLAFTHAKDASRRMEAKDIDAAIDAARRAVALYEGSASGLESRTYQALLGSLLKKKADSSSLRKQWSEAIGLYSEAAVVHERGGVAAELLLADYDAMARAQQEAGLLEQSLTTMQRSAVLAKARTRTLPLMLTRRSRYARAFLRAVARMRSFFVPRGSRR